MTIDQLVLYLAAPLLLLLMVIGLIALKLSHKDFIRFTIKGLGIRICVESGSAEIAREVCDTNQKERK